MLYTEQNYLPVFKVKDHQQLPARLAVVLSYLAFKDQFHSWPTRRQIATNTGLSEPTVSEYLNKLVEMGLLILNADSGTLINTAKIAELCLLKSNQPAELKHWRYMFQYFPFYARAVASDLTFTQSLVMSYLIHLAAQEVYDSSVSYLSACLGLDDETISKAIDQLHDYFGLIGYAARGKGFSFSIVQNADLLPLFRCGNKSQPVAEKASQWLAGGSKAKRKPKSAQQAELKAPPLPTASRGQLMMELARHNIGGQLTAIIDQLADVEACEFYTRHVQGKTKPDIEQSLMFLRRDLLRKVSAVA